MSSENKLASLGSVDELRAQINAVNGIHPQEVSLVGMNGCVRATIQSKARNDNNIDLRNPGSVHSYYFEEQSLLVFDLEDYNPANNE